MQVEASLWDPQCPLLYQGPMELWQDGSLCQRLTISHGLRKLALGSRGLVVNGQPLALRGREIAALTETEALALREKGINLLIAPVTAETESLWELADRIGILNKGKLIGCGTVAALREQAAVDGTLEDVFLTLTQEDTNIPAVHSGGAALLGSEEPPQ